LTLLSWTGTRLSISKVSYSQLDKRFDFNPSLRDYLLNKNKIA